mgnify:FL=1
MKKFLKILLIIIGIVFLIFAALICIGLFVDYDDHIENGRYTYVPEDDNKDNAYVEFNLSDYDKKDSELIYYSSVEEAILNSPLNAENEEFSVPEDFLNHVDEILHIWNGKQYDTIFYRAGSDNDPVQGFVMARCKKQVEEATVQYAFMNATPVTTKADSILISDITELIHSSLKLSDFQQDLNPNYPDTRFVFGYAHDKEIYSLEVEGQKPDGIIEYEEYGITYDESSQSYLYQDSLIKNLRDGDFLYTNAAGSIKLIIQRDDNGHIQSIDVE